MWKNGCIKLLVKDAPNKMIIDAPYKPKGTHLHTYDALVEFRTRHHISVEIDSTPISMIYFKMSNFHFL